MGAGREEQKVHVRERGDAVKVRSREDIGHYCRTQMITASSKVTQTTRSLFVCEVKVMVSLAKSSLVSNFSSFALVQKLFWERSSGPI